MSAEKLVEVIDQITILKDRDGTYGATWSAGGTWSWPTASAAIDEASRAIEDGNYDPSVLIERQKLAQHRADAFSAWAQTSKT